MNVALAKVETSRALSEAFAVARARLPGAGAIAERRQQALDAFETAGLPHRRVEEWKYTDLRSRMKDVLPLAAAPDQAAIARAKSAIAAKSLEGTRRLVLVDGVFVAELSDTADLEPGLTITTLQAALESDDTGLHEQIFAMNSNDAMVALNGAMMTDGVVVTVSNGTILSKPINLVHVTSQIQPAASITRSVVRIGNRASATVVESFIAADGVGLYQKFDATILLIGDEAQLEHLRFVEDSREAFNISSSFVKLGTRSNFNTFGLVTGGALSRYQAVLEMAGQHSKAATNGVNLLNGNQHADTTLFLDHAVPNCESHEIFRAVVDERSHSVFQGRIIVRPDAQKTDAKMMTRALLLSDEASADNKPELEIFADDVTCGHGATVGALDDSLLFYLRARGLPEVDAQALLIQAFVGEAIESIVDDTLRDYAIDAASRWLDARK